MSLDWIFLPREKPCAQLYIIIIILIIIIIIILIIIILIIIIIILGKRVCRTMTGGENMRKLKTGRRKPYMVRLSNKYQMKLERSLGDGSGMDS